MTFPIFSRFTFSTISLHRSSVCTEQSVCPKNSKANETSCCSVQTLDLCNEIVEKVNRENIGNVIDTFHFYAGNSTFEAIDNMKPEKLFIFHINDAENLPKEQLTDAHRLYPGTGILPIKEIKAHFDKIGYDRMVSIEIFRPEYWNQDPFEVARIARQATIEVLGLEASAAGGSW